MNNFKYPKKIEISEKKDIPFIRPSIIDSYSSEKYTFLIFGSDSGVVLYELDSKKKERRKLFNDTYRYFHSFIKIKGELTLCLCTKKYDIDVWSIESNDINKLYSFKRINDYIPGCIFNWEDQFLLIGEKGYQKTDQRTGQKETFSNHILVIDLATQNTVQSLKSKDYSEFLFLTKMTEKNEDYLLSFEDPGLIKKWSSSSN